MRKPIHILGLETSCDETAAAVVRDGKIILSNVVVSSLKEHTRYGGIIPEIASRRQLECINPIVEEAIRSSHLKAHDIDAISVTDSPGLIGSLLVGLSFGRALSFALLKPLLEVDHIKAHLYANFLIKGKESHNRHEMPQLPAIGLVVSGGHTSLYLIKNFHQFEQLGQTRDDAVGEAFDKVARLMGLGYPGGPILDRLAEQGKNSRINFRCARIPDSFDFSFSGVKTAVLYHYNDHKKDPDLSIPQIAYSFQKSVVEVLVNKCLEACERYKIKTLLIGGGVACNSSLRKHLTQACEQHNIRAFFPHPSLCTDNAAMIAGYGYHLLMDRSPRTRSKNSRRN